MTARCVPRLLALCALVACGSASPGSDVRVAGIGDEGGVPSAGGAMDAAASSVNAPGSPGANGGGSPADGSSPSDDANAGATTAVGDGAVDAPTVTPGDGSASGDASGPGGPAYAFPGALGFGRTATGGRGGSVVHVTNVSDLGPGSFRDAVSATNRIVVFDVGGYIALSSPVTVNNNITIAGQTAPGDGVGFSGNEVSFSRHSNVIVRYVRFRQGCTVCTRSDPDFKRSGINLAASSTMIFDHMSIEFAQWNNMDAVGAMNVTVQYSINANPIGQQFAAHTEGGPFTWYGNLFANAHNRCPLAKGNTQFANNVVYDYQAGYTAGNTGGTFTHDIVGNYFIAGPATTSASNAFFQVNNQPIFSSGNYIDGNVDGVLNGSVLASPGGTPLSAAWSPTTASLPIRPAADAYAAVLAKAGASLHRDEVDTQVINDLASLGKSGQLWTSQAQTALANGGFGTLTGGTPPLDTDRDGMPDAWELRYGLNPNSPSDANGDFDHTGYTNIEKYINGLADGSYPTI